MNETTTQMTEAKPVKRTSVTIPETVQERLKQLADQDIRSIPNEISWLVDQEFERRGLNAQPESATAV